MPLRILAPAASGGHLIVHAGVHWLHFAIVACQAIAVAENADAFSGAAAGSVESLKLHDCSYCTVLRGSTAADSAATHYDDPRKTHQHRSSRTLHPFLSRHVKRQR